MKQRSGYYLIGLFLCLLLALPVAAQDGEIDPPVPSETELAAEDDETEDIVHSIFLPLVMGDSTSTSSAPRAASTGVTAHDFGSFNSRLLPVEVQAWWTPAYGHIHAAAQLPVGQTVSGTVNVPVRIVLHDNPGSLYRFHLADESKVLTTVKLGPYTCVEAVCAWSLMVPVDTTKEPDGWRQWRLKAYVKTPEGKSFLTSSGIPIFVKNGAVRKDYPSKCNNTGMVGRAWYDGFDYTNASIECVPLTPVKGIVTFGVRAQYASRHLTAELDKSHFIPGVENWPEQAMTAGQVLFDKEGDFQKFQRLSVDTTRLSNGWHSLAVRSDSPNGAVSVCNGCPEEMSFAAGVAKIWFYVQN